MRLPLLSSLFCCFFALQIQGQLYFPPNTGTIWDTIAPSYLWWLNGKNSYMLPQLQFTFPGSAVPNAPADMVAAIGKNGQLINVVPSQNLVVIRMGNSPDNSLVPTTLNNDIWQYLNDLNCQPLATQTFASPTIAKLYPNPTTARYQVQL